jgi:thiosulfate/3-mercaptopyruvate sulfurtransferase
VTIPLPVPLVSTDWLATHLGQGGLVVLDGSWYLATMGRDPRAEYLAAHIPGAVFFDLEAHSEQGSSLPHMLPDPAEAARRLGELGISNSDAVVAYDGSGNNLSAARVWWHLKVLGHDRVAVLDGGFQRWRAEGRPVESGEVSRARTTFTSRFRPELVRSFDQVRAAVGTASIALLDARAAGRFEGRDPEPRPGIRGGHVPGAKNLPYGQVVAGDGTVLPLAELAERFRSAGVDLDKPVILSCGSGVSAAALALALDLLGHRRYAIYDGSWTEWGGRDDAPIETGPP